MKNKKISILLSSFSSGGTERAMLNLGEAFADKGFNVEFLLAIKEGEFLEQAASRFRIVDLHLNRTYELPFKLLLYVTSNHPFILISNNWKHSLCACLARLFFPFFKLIVVEHGSPTVYPSSKWIFTFVGSIFYRLTTKVVAVSSGVAKGIKQCTFGLSKKVIVIYNAINPDGYKLIEPEKKTNIGSYTVITVGRLVAEKNHNLLFEALAIAILQVDIKLIIIGVGPLEQILKDRAYSLGILDRIQFVGFHPRPHELLSKSDLFVLSSDHEGMGNVLVEALSCGLPIVSTDCPSGPREVLMDGKYGVLVRAGDAIALASAIVSALSCEKSPEIQRKGAERFLPEKIASQYLTILGISL
jgi:glycosyltransferase involved in cell wall biosynthesis